MGVFAEANSALYRSNEKADETLATRTCGEDGEDALKTEKSIFAFSYEDGFLCRASSSSTDLIEDELKMKNFIFNSF
jgi:hypothetical protein